MKITASPDWDIITKKRKWYVMFNLNWSAVIFLKYEVDNLQIINGLLQKDKQLISILMKYCEQFNPNNLI
ncbi:MAG: hypothetical protein EHU54_02485 [Spiroplasma sp. ald]